ncbi:MAG TPA: hypothetical protein PKM65_00135 [Spirochaetota bacterium]|nr:hypothetical protein [Spirochaetota bacterium]HNT12862.1 hypothetical protein [Spirochaetota bacterium]
MADAIIALTAQELMRMKAIDIDADRDDALSLVRELLRRAETQLHGGLRNHLDA